MQKSWRYCYEGSGGNGNSLYEEMARVSSFKGSGITRVQNGERVSVYSVLDAKVFVRNDKPGMRVHTFVAETDNQIKEAKSRIEKLTGVGLI